MAETHDVLGRIQDALNAPSPYKPITHERAAELADIIAPEDDDEVVYALIELLHGIFEAAWHHKDPEGSVMYATRRAYSKTVHHAEGLQEFARLDPDNPRDLRVLRRQFVDKDEAD